MSSRRVPEGPPVLKRTFSGPLEYDNSVDGNDEGFVQYLRLGGMDLFDLVRKMGQDPAMLEAGTRARITVQILPVASEDEVAQRNAVRNMAISVNSRMASALSKGAVYPRTPRGHFTEASLAKADRALPKDLDRLYRMRRAYLAKYHPERLLEQKCPCGRATMRDSISMGWSKCVRCGTASDGCPCAPEPARRPVGS